MNTDTILELTAQAMFLVLALSMPPILVASITGILLSLIQAITQIQEQTTQFAVKLIVVSVVLLITAPWIGIQLYTYSMLIFDRLPELAR